MLFSIGIDIWDFKQLPWSQLHPFSNIRVSKWRQTLTCHRYFFCLMLFHSSLLEPTRNSFSKTTGRQITRSDTLQRFRRSDERSTSRNLRSCALYTWRYMRNIKKTTIKMHRAYSVKWDTSQKTCKREQFKEKGDTKEEDETIQPFPVPNTVIHCRHYGWHLEEQEKTNSTDISRNRSSLLRSNGAG